MYQLYDDCIVYLFYWHYLKNDEYSAESRNDKDGHKFEKKRKKLEDRYENNWELDEENEKD